MGGICCLSAALLALVNTSLGPFADYTVVYGHVVTTLYLLAAVTLGVLFLRSGLRSAP